MSAPSQSINAQALERVPRRLLIVKKVGLGDGVLLRSLAAQLRSRYPEMTIAFVLSQPGVFSGKDGFSVHRWLPRHEGLSETLKVILEIRKRRYDTIVDLEFLSLATAVFVRLLGAPVRIGLCVDYVPLRAKLFTHQVDVNDGVSMWQNFMRVARILDPRLPARLEVTPLPLSEAERLWADQWLRQMVPSPKCRVVALHLGASKIGAIRRWPIKRFVAFAEKLRAMIPEIVVVLTGTPEDRALVEEFKGHYRHPVLDATGLGSVVRTAAVLERCDLLVSGDTGVMHLGAAMGAPTVGLFGATPPSIWAPLGTRASYIYRTCEPCSPCQNSYRGTFPTKCINPVQLKCMTDIDVECVIEAAQKVMNVSGTPRT